MPTKVLNEPWPSSIDRAARFWTVQGIGQSLQAFLICYLDVYGCNQAHHQASLPLIAVEILILIPNLYSLNLLQSLIVCFIQAALSGTPLTHTILGYAKVKHSSNSLHSGSSCQICILSQFLLSLVGPRCLMCFTNTPVCSASTPRVG